MNPRKPHSQLAGFVCELKARLGGHIVVLDRENGAADIDADHRWIVMHMPSSQHVAVHSQAHARDVMKGVARATSIDEACAHADILPRPAEHGAAADDDGAEVTVRIQERLRRWRQRDRQPSNSTPVTKPAKVELEGRDVVFTRFAPYSRIKDHLVHLLPYPERDGTALCGAGLRLGWHRYADQHPDRLFTVCRECFGEAVKRGVAKAEEAP